MDDEDNQVDTYWYSCNRNLFSYRIDSVHHIIRVQNLSMSTALLIAAVVSSHAAHDTQWTVVVKEFANQRNVIVSWYASDLLQHG